mgnify:CR=1 FL=1
MNVKLLYEYKMFIFAFIYIAFILYINEWITVNQPNYYKNRKPLKDYGYKIIHELNPNIANGIITNIGK